MLTYRECINRNRSLIEGQNGKCTCVYCLNTYPSKDVVEYTPSDDCAICPLCGIDSVIAMDFMDDVDMEQIKRWREIYFENCPLDKF